MIPLFPLAVFYNDIHKKLCHQLLTFDFSKTVPGIGVFWIHQMKNPNSIALFLQVFTGLFFQL